MLDEFDSRLLALLQADARTPQSELGERVHLSTAAVSRRVKRLSQAGVIEKISAQLAPAAVGYPLTIIVEVEAESEQVALFDAMRASFLACPLVQQCYHVTGQCDFILVVCARDMEQYQALTRQLFFQNNNVKRFRTFVAMERVRASMDVPINAVACA